MALSTRRKVNLNARFTLATGSMIVRFTSKITAQVELPYHPSTRVTLAVL